MPAPCCPGQPAPFALLEAAIDYQFCPRCGAGLAPRAIKAGEPERLVCGGCAFVFYLDPKVAAGVIVPYEEKVVLLKRGIEPRLGSWVFPGGYVDRGEHPEQAAVREAWEEAGIEVALRGLLGVYHEPPGSPVVLIVYRAELVSGVPQAGDESLDVGLFAPEAIPWPDLGFPTTRAALRDYVTSLETTIHHGDTGGMERQENAGQTAVVAVESTQALIAERQHGDA